MEDCNICHKPTRFPKINTRRKKLGLCSNCFGAFLGYERYTLPAPDIKKRNFESIELTHRQECDGLREDR